MVDRGARPRPSGCRCRGRSAQDDRPHEVDPPMDVKGLRVDSSGNLMRQGRGHPIRRHALEREVDLARDVVFEATDNLALGPAFRGPSGHVVLGPLVPTEPGHHDVIEGGIGLTITASVETVAGDLARGRLDRRGAAEHGEGGLETEPAGVVAGGNEECARWCALPSVESDYWT
jgi:hypothetical protein